MKYSIYLFLFWFQLGMSWAQMPFTYPLKPFTRIHYYKLKAGFERPQAQNGILLTKDQALTLLEILNDTSSFELPQFRCFDPYDEFVFYNAEDKPVSKIEVGFKCQKISAEPFIPLTQNIKIGLSEAATTRLKAFVADISQNLTPNVPEEITMLRHLVKAGETWESIAEKYETTPDMIATLNNKNLMWTPTTDEALEIPLQFQFFSYPPLENYWMNLEIEMGAPETNENSTSKKTNVSEKTDTPPTSPETPVTPTPKEKEPSLVSTPPPQKSDATPSETVILHEVKKGETLFSICRTYKKTIVAIQQANNLKDNQIQIGQKLKIPQE